MGGSSSSGAAGSKALQLFSQQRTNEEESGGSGCEARRSEVRGWKKRRKSLGSEGTAEALLRFQGHGRLGLTRFAGPGTTSGPPEGQTGRFQSSGWSSRRSREEERAPSVLLLLLHLLLLSLLFFFSVGLKPFWREIFEVKNKQPGHGWILFGRPRIAAALKTGAESVAAASAPFNVHSLPLPFMFHAIWN